MERTEQKLGSLKRLKHPLECKMFVSKCYFEQEIKFSYLVWRVKNYKSMTQGNWYDATSRTTGWLLKLLKTEEDVRIVVDCNAPVKSIVCYVSPSWRDDLFSIPYEAERTGAANFKLRIARSSVRNPEDNTDPDVLGLYFRYGMVENCWKSPTATRGIDCEDEKLFTDELENMLATGKYSDCTIRTQGEEYNVHKMVLASRSEVLRKHFVEEGKNELVKSDASWEAMELSLLYIYTGKLDLRKLNEHEVTEVLKLAIDFKMELLELRCVSFLSIACNLDVKKVRRVVKERGVCLSEKSEEFLKYVKVY